MKVVSDNKYNINSQNDFMAMINELQEKYGTVYWTQLEEQVFVYRALGRLEYRELLGSDTTDIEKEDIVCEACLLYPENFNFNDCSAGIPTALFKLILKNSFLDSLESKKLVVAYHRNEMLEFDNQITCIISEAFPNLDIEEIESWDMSKTAKYLSRAEWKLNILRQIPVDYEVSDKMMEAEWAMQHSSPEQVEEMQKQENHAHNQSSTPNNNSIDKAKAHLGETIEERQERLKREGIEKKTPEELARLKALFPEINWDAKVSTNDFNVSTENPAFRTGW